VHVAIGPVEYIIIGFPENQFKGEIVPALADLVESGTVRILDLVFVMKDADGTVTSVEYEDLPGMSDLEGEADGLLREEDLEMVAEVLEPNSSGLMIVWEDLWASRLAAALRDAGGVIISGERIPHDIVEAAFEGISAG
jgi:uncharacterized membrane protein